jgi:hypothetical protein
VTRLQLSHRRRYHRLQFKKSARSEEWTRRAGAPFAHIRFPPDLHLKLAHFAPIDTPAKTAPLHVVSIRHGSLMYNIAVLFQRRIHHCIALLHHIHNQAQLLQRAAIVTIPRPVNHDYTVASSTTPKTCLLQRFNLPSYIRPWSKHRLPLQPRDHAGAWTS